MQGWAGGAAHYPTQAAYAHNPHSAWRTDGAFHERMRNDLAWKGLFAIVSD